MNKIYIGTILLCLAVLAIGPAFAAFGDRVPTAPTLPVGTPLSAFGAPANGYPIQAAFHIEYHDIGVPTYTATDEVYLHFGIPPVFASGPIVPGDIRLTDVVAGPGYKAGSVVHAGDDDLLFPLASLKPLPSPYPAAGATGFYYFATVPGLYNPTDPVYLKLTPTPGAPPQRVQLNDLRITAFNAGGYFYPAGTKVAVGNIDIGYPLSGFKLPTFGLGLGLGVTAGAAPIGQLAFYNQLAQFSTVAAPPIPIYADGDPVYFDVPPLGEVSPGDIQLS